MITAPNGYFTQQEAATVSVPVFIITLGGSYEVPQSDLLDPGSLSLTRAQAFSDLSSGGHTFVLDNSTGRYSPGRSTFIWNGSTWWRKAIKVELGYKRPGYQGIIDKVSLYEGLITDWKVKEPKDFTDDAPSQGITVEVTSKDHVSLLLERQIGMPADDGTPYPVVYGTVFKNLLDLKDLRLGGASDHTADFESNNLSEFNSTNVYGGGSLAASTTEKYAGNYSCKAMAPSTGANATGVFGIFSNKISVSFTFYVKFTQIPVSLGYTNGMVFAGLQREDDNELLSLGIGNDGYMYMHDPYAAGYKKSSWNIRSSLNQWVRVTIMYRQYIPGTPQIPGGMRVFVNGSVVVENIVPYVNLCHSAWLGLSLPLETGPFTAYFDALQLDYSCHFTGYYMPGYPYNSILDTWSDGALVPRQVPTYFSNVPYITWARANWVFGPYGDHNPYDSYAQVPAYGLIDWLQLGSPPSGTLFGKFVKDTQDHPVDQITSLLTVAGLGSIIDSTNFAACKTAMPNDKVGSYFEGTTCAAAISGITGRMLYDLLERSGKLCLIPYTGNHLGASVLTINRSKGHTIEQNFPQDNIKTGITTKWGWYEKDNSLFYRHDNASLKAILGDLSQELDLSYGSPVQSGDATTARAKADLLLKRLSGAVDTFVVGGDLSLARVELGDGVLMVNKNFNDADLIYEVVGKIVDMTNKTVELTVCRYQGEG